MRLRCDLCTLRQLAEKGLSSREIHLLLVLAGHLSENNAPDLEELAEDMGKDASSVSRIAQNLEKKGFLRVKRVSGQKSGYKLSLALLQPCWNGDREIVVGLFQDALNAAGCLIRFEVSFDEQLGYAGQLLDVCEGDMAEIRALLLAHAADDWAREHQPTLKWTLKSLDRFRAHPVYALYKRAPDLPTSWEDL